MRKERRCVHEMSAAIGAAIPVHRDREANASAAADEVAEIWCGIKIRHPTSSFTPPLRSRGCAWHRLFFAFGTIGVMPEPTNDLQKKKNELDCNFKTAITKFETDTGLTVTEIAPHRLPTQDAWNQLRGLKLESRAA